MASSKIIVTVGGKQGRCMKIVLHHEVQCTNTPSPSRPAPSFTDLAPRGHLRAPNALVSFVLGAGGAPPT